MSNIFKKKLQNKPSGTNPFIAKKKPSNNIFVKRAEFDPVKAEQEAVAEAVKKAEEDYTASFEAERKAYERLLKVDKPSSKRNEDKYEERYSEWQTAVRRNERAYAALQSSLVRQKSIGSTLTTNGTRKTNAFQRRLRAS